jgi:hypothetical protein
MTANPGNVITFHDLASLTNAVYEISFTAKNIIAAFAKPVIWPFSRLVFSYEDFGPSSLTPMEKELRKPEIPVCSTSTPAAQEISDTNKNSLSPEDMRPFPKPGPRYDRRRRNKVESRILTDAAVKDYIGQQALARAAVKKKYFKGAKNYRNKI